MPDTPRPERPDLLARIRSSRWGNLMVLAIATAVVVGAMWFLNRDDGVTKVDIAAASDVPAPAIGELVPAFDALTIEGESITVPTGTPTWIVFNATWCSSCRAEAPDVEEAWRTTAAEHGVQVLAVYLSEGSSAIEPFVTSLGLTYPHIPDPQNAISSAYRILGIPAHFFIDADGRLVATEIGSISKTTISTHLAALTAASPATD